MLEAPRLKCDVLWTQMDQSVFEDARLAVQAVPGRMEAGREHRVPLSDAALAVLREMARLGTDPGAFVFPGARAGKPLSEPDGHRRPTQDASL